MTKEPKIRNKLVYGFGEGEADGYGTLKNLLGGKGANLAEMAGHPDLKLPVPPGFTITTEVCNFFYSNQRKYPEHLKKEVLSAIEKLEKQSGKKFGDPSNPLLLSVRSGARQSMPGMMDTVLNIGLNDQTIKGAILQTGDERFVFDSYRRLIMMYADVVMEKAAGLEPPDGKGIRKILEEKLESLKKMKNYSVDTDLSPADLKELVQDYKQTVFSVLGKPFPQDTLEQLWGGISAVFASWNGKRAIEYRRIEKIPNEWGTAVNVQTMVFGNMGNDCVTGVAFTRNPGNGENHFYGEYLINAQGEDVVAGIRTPAPINEFSKNSQSKELQTLESLMPEIYEELDEYQRRLETHYKDMQDIEFTVEKGKLYILQTRVGKRNGVASVKMATDMYEEGLIDKNTAIKRVSPAQLLELLLPQVDPLIEKNTPFIAKGLPAGPGGASGKVVFTNEEAISWTEKGEKVILVREETSPEDVDGMHTAQGILTSKGGMTSHAALVARGWGKCCIVGCSELEIDLKNKCFTTLDGTVIKHGEWITLNGTKGLAYKGALPLVNSDIAENSTYKKLMTLIDETKKLGVRANVENPSDAEIALNFGAEGIGLFRTEHMFYGEESEKPLLLLRKMILSQDEKERREALDELYNYVKKDIKATLKVMKGLPVTIRLLDPPLHEFVPHDKEKLIELSKELKVPRRILEKRILALHENNPMLGHRGVRLGISYPEITEMQIRAILQSACELTLEGIEVRPEIMIPVVVSSNELKHQKVVVEKVSKEICGNHDLSKVKYLFGSMIETPRAAIKANRLAIEAEFFSFGTNDLTQMSFGFSRDDIGGFLPTYLNQNILYSDPFVTIDQDGIGELLRIAIERGRSVRPDLKIGLCGEHGGDPESVKFCHNLGIDYVSCSPFRVPIARLAAAQAVLEEN